MAQPLNKTQYVYCINVEAPTVQWANTSAGISYTTALNPSFVITVCVRLCETASTQKCKNVILINVKHFKL